MKIRSSKGERVDLYAAANYGRVHKAAIVSQLSPHVKGTDQHNAYRYHRPKAR